MILRREPALWATLAYAIIANISAFIFHFNVTQEGTLNAVVAAGLGLVVTLNTRDGWGATALGFVKAIIAAAIAFGLHWAPEQQAIFMTLAAAIVAMFIRTQVFAKVPPPPTT